MKRILLVDDDKDVLASLEMLLKYTLRGVAIESVHSVDAAVARLRKPGIDLVVSDVNLKQHQGTEIKRRVPGVPILYITGDATWHPPAGAKVVAKTNADEILRAIKEFLGESMNVQDALLQILADGTDVDEVVSQLVEVSPPGFSGTVKAMEKHMPKKKAFPLAWAMYKRGAKPHYPPKSNPKGIKNYVAPDEYADRKKKQ